jgi:alkylation response protein AidB-like acyl-CoA dehydrogenase
VPADAPGVQHHRNTACSTASAPPTCASTACRLGADALSAEPAPAGTILEAALDYGAGLLCAEAVGAMDALFAATLEYLKTRQQFGVPIGKFQALQHRMADMYIHLEQARSMACWRPCCDSAGDAAPSAARGVRRQVPVGQAARFVGQQAVQLHGGMGVTDELPAAALLQAPDHDRADAGRRRPPPGALHGAAGLPGRRPHEQASGISKTSSGPGDRPRHPHA